MAQRTIKARGEVRAATRVFSSPYALAYLRRAVAGGLTPADARQRYLDFVNRSPAPRQQRAA